MERRIILFELNEVPWRVLEAFCRWRPGSCLAQILPQCHRFETLAEDSSRLQPWITWPSVHRGVDDGRHAILGFGQNLSEVDLAYPPLWSLLGQHGVSTGICGSLHAADPDERETDRRFFIPDPFTSGARTIPRDLDRFHRFVQTMRAASQRNVGAGLPAAEALALLLGSRSLGIRPGTLLECAARLADERVRSWTRTRRRTLHAAVTFDVFFRQFTATRPGFSTFHTNHVAAAMHRYWAASFQDDYDQFLFSREWVKNYRNEIDLALRTADRFTHTLVRFCERNPEYQLWIASSMGQAATEAVPTTHTLMMADRDRFMATLDIEPGRWRGFDAMFPEYVFSVPAVKAPGVRQRLGSIRIADRPLQWIEIQPNLFMIQLGHANPGGEPGEITVDGTPRDAGWLGWKHVAVDDQANANAFHIPNGCLLIFDPRDRRPKGPGPRISTLDIAPAILDNFSCAVPRYMNRPVRLAGGPSKASIDTSMRTAAGG